MPIFLNGHISPQIYKNNEEMSEKSNQEKFRLNFLQEVLHEQQKLNVEMTGSVTQFESTLQQTRLEQSHNFADMATVLARQENLSEKVFENISEQKKSTNIIDDKLNQLENMHIELSKSFLNEELTSQAILDTLAYQQAMILDINRKLVDYEGVAAALALQAEKQDEIYKLLAQQADLQGIFHHTIMEHLGKQDAVGATITGELSEIKTALSTKVNAILDKIEDQYSKVTQFFLSLIMPNIMQKKVIKGEIFKTNKKKDTESTSAKEQ